VKDFTPAYVQLITSRDLSFILLHLPWQVEWCCHGKSEPSCAACGRTFSGQCWLALTADFNCVASQMDTEGWAFVINHKFLSELSDIVRDFCTLMLFVFCFL
jgi:hypothetical protein